MKETGNAMGRNWEGIGMKLRMEYKGSARKVLWKILSGVAGMTGFL